MVPARKIAESTTLRQGAELDEPLALSAEPTNNPTHEMQRLLLARLEAQLGSRRFDRASPGITMIESVIAESSRLAGPVGLVALSGLLAWLIL
jgi:hypothetical protein